MSETIILTIVFFGVALIGMAIGVIFSNRSLRGSCGGLSNLKDSKGKSMCEACTDPSPDCKGEPLEEAASARED
jgi:hypothetical protein